MQDAFSDISEVFILKASLTLQRGSNCQIILKLFGYYIFCKICSTKKFKANLKVSEVLITYVTNGGKTRAMLHTGAGHSNNCQIIILKLFGYDIFCYNLQHKKKFKANFEVSEVLITYVTNRGIG